VVTTHGGVLLTTPNASLGSPHADKGNTTAGATVIIGRGCGISIGEGVGERRKVLDGGEGRARRALRLQNGIQQHESPRGVAHGGAWRASKATVVAHVERQRHARESGGGFAMDDAALPSQLCRGGKTTEHNDR